MDESETVLITGATGLIGSHLTELMHGRKIVLLIRDMDPQSRLIANHLVEQAVVVNGNLEDEHLVERIICDHEVRQIFHLGAQTLVGSALRMPIATFEANIRGTYFLLEACRRQRDLVRHIVIASSDKAYGTSLRLPYFEDMSLHGKGPYDVSKSCADLIASCYEATYDLPIAIARCGNVFGEGDQNWSRLIPGTIRHLIEGKSPLIRSDGTYLRDYIYVKDVVEGYCLLAQKRARGAFNFGPGEPRTVLEVVELICKLMKAPFDPIIQNSAEHEIRDQYLDSSKARSILGWRPRFSFEQALEKTIAWYEQRVLV